MRGAFVGIEYRSHRNVAVFDFHYRPQRLGNTGRTVLDCQLLTRRDSSISVAVLVLGSLCDSRSILLVAEAAKTAGCHYGQRGGGGVFVGHRSAGSTCLAIQVHLRAGSLGSPLFGSRMGVFAKPLFPNRSSEAICHSRGLGGMSPRAGGVCGGRMYVNYVRRHPHSCRGA